MRLFSCLRLSPAAVDHLATTIDPLRASAGRQLRWTPTEQWHITTGFYGDQPGGHCDDIGHLLAAIAATTPPLRLHLHGAGSFSAANLWMGIGGDTAELAALAGACSLGLDERPRFRGHVTVAYAARTGPVRPAERTQYLHEAVHALSIYRGPEFRVDSLELVASELGKGKSGGALHTIVQAWPLGAALTDEKVQS